MQELADVFHSLSPDQKQIVHLHLCEYALEKWQTFAGSRRRITYAESVCGTSHTVDKKLPADALRSAHEGRDVAGVEERYADPITAMQDFDLEFPEPVRYAYYAIYNAFNKYAMKESIDDWLIVNQAISSETDQSKWETILRSAFEKAR